MLISRNKSSRVPEAVPVRLRDHLHNTRPLESARVQSSFRFEREGLSRHGTLARAVEKANDREKERWTSSCHSCEKFRIISSVGKRWKLETVWNWLCYRRTAVTNEW